MSTAQVALSACPLHKLQSSNWCIWKSPVINNTRFYWDATESAQHFCSVSQEQLTIVDGWRTSLSQHSCFVCRRLSQGSCIVWPYKARVCDNRCGDFFNGEGPARSCAHTPLPQPQSHWPGRAERPSYVWHDRIPWAAEVRELPWHVMTSAHDLMTKQIKKSFLITAQIVNFLVNIYEIFLSFYFPIIWRCPTVALKFDLL